MPINLEIGENDHIPDNMTLDQMKAALDMSEEEALRLTKGDDPLFTPEQVAAAYAKPDSAPDNVLDGIKAPDPVQQAADPAPAAQTPAAADVAPPAPPVVPDLTDAQKVIADHMKVVDDLNAKYDDGDMTKAEWSAALAAQTDAVATAKATVAQVQTATQTFQQSFAQAWQPVISAFQGQFPHLNGPNVDPVVFKAWDNALVQVNSQPEYAHLGLQARAELVYDVLAPQMRAMGRVFPDRVAAAAPAQTPAAPALRTDPRPDPMQTLAGIANASLPPVNDSTFAALDTLDPEAAEAAMSRMSPDQLDRYLNMYGGSYHGADS